MNKDNNITNINEYRERMMPDASAFNINEPSGSVEYISEELINSYVWELGNNTPDLWSRIEAGFEEEAKDVIRERKKNSARVWKTFGYVAAAVLITIIAIPVMKLGTNSEKSEDTMMMTESTTELSGEKSESVAMEAPSESYVESEGAKQEDNVVTNDSQSLEEGSNDIVAIKGIQTDARQLKIQGKFIFDDDADIVKFSIKVINDNSYEELVINVGDEITLSNPLFVQTMDSMLIETEITLDSIGFDDAGNLTGRIIDLELHDLHIEKEYIDD